MTKPYIARFSDATDKGNSYKFLFDILFSSPTDTKKFMFVKNNVPLSSKYPFSISLKELTLLGEVDIYLSDKLYSNDKSFFKNVPETGAININSNLLFFFRNQLQDPSYNVSKIYGFRQKRGFHSIDLKFDNFVTDFDFKIKMKKQLATNGIKKIFESNLYLLKENTEIEAPPTIKETIEGQMDKCNINILKKQFDLKPLAHTFEKIFLYDLENMINEIYVTQLNKEFPVYDLITFSSENKNNKKLDLVTPDNNIKFQLKRDAYKNSIGFQLAKVHEKKSYTVINNKILNFGLLKSDKNHFVGQKYKMKEIIDIVRVLGLQVESENYLNPINISMNSNELLKKLEKYKKKKVLICIGKFLI